MGCGLAACLCAVSWKSKIFLFPIFLMKKACGNILSAAKKMTSDIKLQNSFQVQRCSNIFSPPDFQGKQIQNIFSIAIAGQNVALTQTASQSDTLWDYTAGKIPTDAHFGHGCMDDEGDNYANYADDDNADDDDADDDDDAQAWPLTGRRTQHAASLRALPTSGGGRCSFL